MHPKDADGMANSVDPDQTASPEADLSVPIHRICTVVLFVRIWLTGWYYSKVALFSIA